MSTKILDKAGLEYLWTKLKAYFAPKAHTHNAFETKHSYTTAANAAKDWYRIANANTSQTDTTKPIHVQFILTAYNASYDAGYYERWFVNAEVFGRTAHIVIFGNTQAPFSQARVLYENTIADLDANDRPAIDIYLNYQLANGTTKIEIEEVYNQGWTFVADGQITVSTVPTGFESVACDSVRANGVGRSVYSDYSTYIGLQRSDITSNITLADNNTYRSRVLNCTGTRTVTVPSINSVYSWFLIKNFNTTSGVITVHPSTTSVLIDGSNADIKLQPGEYIVIHSRTANSYSIIADGRWKSQKANDSNVVHLTGNESISGVKTFSSTISGSINGNAATSTDASRLKSSTPDSTAQKVVYTGGQPEIGTSAGNAYVGSSNNVQLISVPENGTVITQTNANAQNLRFVWNGNYFSDIFVSPNDRHVWHRDVVAKTAYPWRRLVEENAAGITAPNWDISIAGNAATASSAAKLTTARKINGVSFDGSADVTLTAVVSSASRSADIAANGTFTVPSYIVGAQALLVYLDGCLSRQGDGWTEVGTAGAASTTIKFLQLIPKAMEIVVRVN